MKRFRWPLFFLTVVLLFAGCSPKNTKNLFSSITAKGLAEAEEFLCASKVHIPAANAGWDPAHNYQQDLIHPMISKQPQFCPLVREFLSENYETYIDKYEDSKLLWSKGAAIVKSPPCFYRDLHAIQVNGFYNEPVVEDLQIGDSFEKLVETFGPAHFTEASEPGNRIGGRRLWGWRFPDNYFFAYGKDGVEAYYIVKDVNLPPEYHNLLKTLQADSASGLPYIGAYENQNSSRMLSTRTLSYLSGFRAIWSSENDRKWTVEIYQNYMGDIYFADTSRDYVLYQNLDFVYHELYRLLGDHYELMSKEGETFGPQGQFRTVNVYEGSSRFPGDACWMLHYNDNSQPDRYFSGIFANAEWIGGDYLNCTCYYFSSGITLEPFPILLDTRTGKEVGPDPGFYPVTPFLIDQEEYIAIGSYWECNQENQTLTYVLNLASAKRDYYDSNPDRQERRTISYRFGEYGDIVFG